MYSGIYLNDCCINLIYWVYSIFVGVAENAVAPTAPLMET